MSDLTKYIIKILIKLNSTYRHRDGRSGTGNGCRTRRRRTGNRISARTWKMPLGRCRNISSSSHSLCRQQTFPVSPVEFFLNFIGVSSFACDIK